MIGASGPSASSIRPIVATKPLNVLTLTPFYPSLEDPTQGSFIVEPLGWTERLGVDNHVIAVHPFYRGQRQAPRGHESRCTCKRYFSLPGNLGLPFAGDFLAAGLIGTMRRMHSLKPFDLIHAHAALPCGQAAAAISKQLRIPFVVSVHGLDVFFTKQAGAAFGSLCRTACERIYQSADAVICISERVRERLTDVFAAKSTVVYNGVDTTMFSPSSELLSPLIVLSVGNLIHSKGHALLLYAFARVLKESSNYRLEIIGDGGELKNLVGLAESLGISGQVNFRGRQNREAVAQAMKRCAVFALPSHYEGLGCVYLEAMASGKPAIGCRGQGIDEIIDHGKNGLLVSPGGEAELAHALTMLLENRDFRHRLGIAGRETILRSLTLEHQAAKLAEVYRRCVA